MIIFIKKSVKKILGVDNLALYKQKKIRTFQKLIYRKKYNASDIVAKMAAMGMKRGSIVFIHSSMTQFYNYQGSVESLIKAIIEFIGEEGTLLMPAYPHITKPQADMSNEIQFDVVNTKSAAGYLTEVFRKYHGVKRSINIQHSVCAIGKDADYFLSEHHLSETAWDVKSPYYKLYEKEALIFAFGLPYFLGTTIHCTESLLRDKYTYFSQFFTQELTYKYLDQGGNTGEHTMLFCDVYRKRDKKRMIKKYFGQSNFNYAYISNLRIEMVKAYDMLEIFLEQANSGVTMYSYPDPKPFLKDGKFIEK